MIRRLLVAWIALTLILLTTAVAGAGRKHRASVPGPSPTLVIDPGGGSGSGGSSTVVTSKLITLSVPTWNTTVTQRFNITSDSNGIIKFEILDTSGNVLFSATRAEYDSLMAGLTTVPTTQPLLGPANATVASPTDPVFTPPPSPFPSMDRTIVTSMSTVVDSPLTVVARIQD